MKVEHAQFLQTHFQLIGTGENRPIFPFTLYLSNPIKWTVYISRFRIRFNAHNFKEKNAWAFKNTPFTKCKSFHIFQKRDNFSRLNDFSFYIDTRKYLSLNFVL